MKRLLFLSFALCLLDWSEQACDGVKDKRVYTFAFGNDWKPYEFINDDGDLMGISYDIVRKVCEKACKTCAYIVYNDYKICWDPATMLGEGLNHRYWDACVGWVVTKPRSLVYSLFGPLTNDASAALFVRDDSNIRSFDPSRHTIGLRQSFRNNEKCLKDRGGWNVENAAKYTGWGAILDAVMDESIDVGFVDESAAMARSGLRKIGDSMTCGEAGPSLMLRYDVAPDYAWFAEYLKEVRASPFYKWICNIAKIAYGGDPHCMT